MAERLVMGRIVWVEVADANGIRKLRPAVVVTPTDRLTATAPFDVVAITSRLPNPLPDDHVMLPWHRLGHPHTRLNRPCAAVCTWLAQVVPGDVQDTAGVVPGPRMRTILVKIAAALSPGGTEASGSQPDDMSSGDPSSGTKPPPAQ